MYRKIARIVSVAYARQDKDRKDLEDAQRLFRYLVDVPDKKTKKHNR